MTRLHRKAAAIVAGSLIALLLSMSAASAFTESLDVLIVVDKTSYHVGDIVNATVYVIWGGTLTDPGYIDFTVTTYANPSWTESFPITRESTGVYRSSFQLLSNMTFSIYSVLDLHAAVTVGPLSDTGYAMLFVTGEPVLTDRVSLSAYEASPRPDGERHRPDLPRRPSLRR